MLQSLNSFVYHCFSVHLDAEMLFRRFTDSLHEQAAVLFDDGTYLFDSGRIAGNDDLRGCLAKKLPRDGQVRPFLQMRRYTNAVAEGAFGECHGDAAV